MPVGTVIDLWQYVSQFTRIKKVLKSKITTFMIVGKYWNLTDVAVKICVQISHKLMIFP